ncbi:hypothetical protein OROHE_010020 [Orobanche hederae]
MSYDNQLAAAKKAASLAARTCQDYLDDGKKEMIIYEFKLYPSDENVNWLVDRERIRICYFLEKYPLIQKTMLQSDVQSKSDKSPVTVADYGSQAIVSFILGKELPSVPFSLVAEEDSEDLRKEGSRETLHRITELVNETLASDGMSPLSEEEVLIAIDNGKSEGGPHGQHWVLDPIDGTKGVGCLFFAQIDAGTYVQSLDGSQPTKVHVSAIENSEEASFFESYEAAHSSHDLSNLIAKKLGVKAPPVRIDSQVKYGTLSRGDGAIYIRFPRNGYREKIWDHAAGYIVVAEAGGVVRDAARNPLDFSKGRHLDLDTRIIVSNQKLMPALLKAVQESIKEKASSW